MGGTPKISKPTSIWLMVLTPLYTLWSYTPLINWDPIIPFFCSGMCTCSSLADTDFGGSILDYCVIPLEANHTDTPAPLVSYIPIVSVLWYQSVELETPVLILTQQLNGGQGTESQFPIHKMGIAITPKGLWGPHEMTYINQLPKDSEYKWWWMSAALFSSSLLWFQPPPLLYQLRYRRDFSRTTEIPEWLLLHTTLFFYPDLAISSWRDHRQPS